MIDLNGDLEKEVAEEAYRQHPVEHDNVAVKRFPHEYLVVFIKNDRIVGTFIGEIVPQKLN